MLFFGKNLIHLRNREGKKQAEMLGFIGINRTTWNNYENQKSFPKLEDFIKIAKHFGISETDLLHTNLEKEAAKHLPKAGEYIDFEKEYYNLLRTYNELSKKTVQLQEEQVQYLKKHQLVK
ncbi:MAG: helix-turn-helix transcriptional regulator [Bacteroidetes bacterium]|nr:helix-turn-helix transcriptional regulator [Bacteroidota bacterium]